MDINKGDHITLSGISTSAHLTSHADGFNHYGAMFGDRPAPGVGELPLEHFIGLCRVLQVRGRRGHSIEVTDLVGGAEAVAAVGGSGERIVLLATGTFDGYAAWNTDFSGVSVDLVHALAARGIITIGIDTPSVDPQTSKLMAAHRALLGHGIAILEGLALAGVAAGVYELMAQPMKIIGGDGAPVRAVLRRLGPQVAASAAHKD